MQKKINGGRQTSTRQKNKHTQTRRHAGKQKEHEDVNAYNMQADNNSQIRAKKLSKKANRQKGEPILKSERQAT